MRNRTNNANDSISNLEIELRSCRENLDRALADKECLQRQSAAHLMEIDKLRQDKEALEMRLRVSERELSEVKEKLAGCNRNLNSASGNVAQQEAIICQLRGFGVLAVRVVVVLMVSVLDELKLREEKNQKLQSENRHILESIAILLSAPSRFVESIESSIKDRIREILIENKDKTAVRPENLINQF